VVHGGENKKDLIGGKAPSSSGEKKKGGEGMSVVQTEKKMKGKGFRSKTKSHQKKKKEKKRPGAPRLDEFIMTSGRGRKVRTESLPSFLTGRRKKREEAALADPQKKFRRVGWPEKQS